ncbi:hypothetical protein [Breoghania sp.]|uniref:hypothetical protein n=1 Tax=Breoghania sp. TaxID=2065378 RepID=UPI0032048436
MADVGGGGEPDGDAGGKVAQVPGLGDGEDRFRVRQGTRWMSARSAFRMSFCRFVPLLMGATLARSPAIENRTVELFPMTEPFSEEAGLRSSVT